MSSTISSISKPWIRSPLGKYPDHDLLDGNRRSHCRGSGIPVADLPAASGLYENRRGDPDIRRFFRNLPYEPHTGGICGHSGRCVRVFSGDHRKHLGQRPSSYGCQYLVAGIYGGGAMASGEKSFLDTADLCDAFVYHDRGNRIFPAEAGNENLRRAGGEHE